MDTPYSLLVLDEVASTQDLARARTRPDLPVVVIAHRQTQGRGRSGSEWETAPRAVAASVGLVPAWEPSRWPLIPLAAGVAARRVMGSRVTLKWPNDLLVGGDKVGGILVEAKAEVVVVGMGLNLFWPDPMEGAGALYEGDPGSEEGPGLATRWAEEVLAVVSGKADDWPRRQYVEACATLGEEITWEPHGRGKAVDVGQDGSLEVVTPDGRRASLASGSIRHVRTA